MVDTSTEVATVTIDADNLEDTAVVFQKSFYDLVLALRAIDEKLHGLHKTIEAFAAAANRLCAVHGDDTEVTT